MCFKNICIRVLWTRVVLAFNKRVKRNPIFCDRRVVMYHAHIFRAGIKCWHCASQIFFKSYFFLTGLVEEVTIDKSLSSRQQKEQLVAMTPSTSHKAKLVRLADKLYNMRDKLHNPRDPSRGNVQDYFEWSAKVVKGLRGTNALLEKEVDNLLMERNVYDLSV